MDWKKIIHLIVGILFLLISILFIKIGVGGDEYSTGVEYVGIVLLIPMVIYLSFAFGKLKDNKFSLVSAISFILLGLLGLTFLIRSFAIVLPPIILNSSFYISFYILAPISLISFIIGIILGIKNRNK